MLRIHTLILVIFLCIGCKEQEVKPEVEALPPSDIAILPVKADTMNRDEFWKIIDYSRKNANTREAQNRLIINQLAAYSPEQIIKFEEEFRLLVIEADDYKVLAAQKIIQGWVSDDSYLYFRCWLIGLGKVAFEEALKNPETLCDKVSPDEFTDFEELMYVATEAFIENTGKANEDETFPRSIAYNKGLDYDSGAPPTKGDKWNESELPSSYPKLWAKFH